MRSIKVKSYCKLLSPIILIFSALSCKQPEQKINVQPIKVVNFGKLTNQNDSLSVELELNQFGNYRDLLDRTENIVCDDSIPIVTIRNVKNIKRISFLNPCWNDYACILIRQKNIIQLHNDTIYKLGELTYPLDSLENVLRRDIENYGKKLDFADNPSKLIIFVSYSSLQSDKFISTLDRLTDVYLKITDSTNIKIWLNRRIEVLPPPAPPLELKTLEEI